jgi:hypothetical protein
MDHTGYRETYCFDPLTWLEYDEFLVWKELHSGCRLCGGESGFYFLALSINL